MTKSHAQSFDSVPTAIESLILIAFSLIILFEQINGSNALFIYSTPTFWVISGIIIFFAGSFFTFIYAQSMLSSPNQTYIFRIITGISGILQNILFLIAFIISKNELKPGKSRSSIKNRRTALKP